LIGSTTSKKGLTVRAVLDTHPYETGRKITDKQLAQVNSTPAEGCMTVAARPCQ